MKIEEEDKIEVINGITVIDDFLPAPEFAYLKTTLIGSNNNTPKIPWTYYPYKARSEDFEDSIYEQQFVHIFYKGLGALNGPSDQIGLIAPVLDRLAPEMLLRAKLNLTPVTPKVHEFLPHTDANISVPFTTAVYYINDNNGYTGFSDGTKVESKANRLVYFDGSMEHFGTTSTNSKTRLVLNLNYIGGEYSAFKE